jgi:tRNA(Met) cytidine acetyltransferase
VQAAEEGVDYLGASFGADAPLLDFWRSCDCLPVRVGLKREVSSGAHAVMVMRPLSKSGRALFAQARRRFIRQWPTLLSEPLAQLEAPLVQRLLYGGDAQIPGDEMWGDACAFATTRRDYGNSLQGLSECLLYTLSEGGLELEPRERQLAIAKVLQRRPWAELVRLIKLSGRREAEEKLRGVFRKLCEHYR